MAQQQRPKILIVDDDRLGTEVRAEIIRMSGFDVDVAFSSREALAKTAHQEFDIFVVDYDMPDMNGLELATELRRQGHTLPILMLSGRLEPPTEAGVEFLTGFISKGEGPSTLVESLNSLLATEFSAA